MVYKLSATLSSHSSDVRAVASPTNDLILSASRDTTAISWAKLSEGPAFTPSAILKAGTRYVNAIAYIPPTADAPNGYAVTGGQDTVINIFALDSSSKEDPDYTLLGHTENVCALDVGKEGEIISGSWDKTAKVWKNFRLVHDLKGHQASVWAVLAVSDDKYLTGSADKTIKLWQQHKVLVTFNGHVDAVRGLSLVPDIGFASCSNDSEIRVWTFEGDQVLALSGHTSFVYSLAILPNGNIISGGEDRSVRIWEDGECTQTIVHPAISVWSVSTMPNGDIVSGSSDGHVRVFSASEERWASQAELKEYDDLVASQALPAQQVGDVKKDDLPGLDALNVPGKKSGEVKMVRNGSVVEAHQWDTSNGSWQKIGDVVDAVGSGRKQLYDGKEYDYVFDVDIQDGVPPLKLPYNASENPYGAAQRFLDANELPHTYVDQVVQFIEKNTAGVTLGGGNNDFVDPFTGASRYQASANSVPTAPSMTNYADPYTGSSRYSGAPPADPPSAPARPAILPVSKALYFKQATVSAMQIKLYQFDEVFRNEISTYSIAIYPNERDSLDETFQYLSQAVASPLSPPKSPITVKHIDAIIAILDRWPSSQRFPAIDLSRLIAGYCSAVFTAPSLRERFLDALFRAADWTAEWATPLPKPRETNVVLLLRTLVNIFQDGTPIGESWVTKIFEALYQAPYLSLSKAQRLAFSTVLFNFSVVNLRTVSDQTATNQHLALLLRVLQTETEDSETVYRALVALGNVAHSAKSRGISFGGIHSTALLQSVRALPAKFPEDRIKNVAGEISKL